MQMHDLNITPWYADTCCVTNDMRYGVIELRQKGNIRNKIKPD